MTREFLPDQLDIKAFTQVNGVLAGHDSLLRYERLARESQGLHPDLIVDWRAEGFVRQEADGSVQYMIHLKVAATLPLQCQRCLQPVDLLLEVNRNFRFVQNETIAESLDEHSEDDVLVISREFNLRELIEDELVMEIPLVPAHVVCPVPVSLKLQDEGFEAAIEQKPNPFAALSNLRTLKKDK